MAAGWCSLMNDCVVKVTYIPTVDIRLACSCTQSSISVSSRLPFKSKHAPPKIQLEFTHSSSQWNHTITFGSIYEFSVYIPAMSKYTNTRTHARTHTATAQLTFNRITIHSLWNRFRCLCLFCKERLLV